MSPAGYDSFDVQSINSRMPESSLPSGFGDPTAGWTGSASSALRPFSDLSLTSWTAETIDFDWDAMLGDGQAHKEAQGGEHRQDPQARVEKERGRNDAGETTGGEGNKDNVGSTGPPS